MKLRKILSAVLVAVMLFSIFAINVSADAPLSFTVTESASVSAKGSLMKELFNIEVSIDESKFCALDGYTDDYTITINSAKVKDPVTAEYYNYYTDPDKFFAVFTSGTEENPFAGALVEVDFTIEFASNHVFGELNYTIDISGFMEPYSIGFGPVDDALSNVALPVEVKKTGNIWQFPAIDNITINNVPVKSNYYDTEKFDLEGTQVYVETKVATAYDQRTDTYTYEAGKAGTVTYSEASSNMFTCNPSKDEKLSVLSTEVVTFFAGQYLSRIPVNVDHKVSDGYVCITTDYYTENKPGYHAKVCEGCGETHDPQPHVVADEEAWTANGDQGFLSNGTESNICADCGTILVRDAHGSADYNDALADYHFIRVILDYINMLLNIINGTMK